MRAVSEHLGHRARAAAVAAAVCFLSAALLLVLGSGPASSAPVAKASQSVTVTIKRFKFNPGRINVSKGDRVVWVGPLHGGRGQLTHARPQLVQCRLEMAQRERQAWNRGRAACP